MQVCFIGHRTIEKNEELIGLLKETIITLIHKGVSSFLFGGRGEFDNVSWEVVTQLKQNYPFVKRIYVRSAYPNIDKSYEEYLLKSYEDTYFPPKLRKAGKYSYVERNYEMIDNSTYCVFYYNENYVLKSKQTSQQSNGKSGTKIAYQYAIRKKKEIINLYNK